MAAKETLELMVCDACGGLWYPQVWRSHNGCPSCHHPVGKPKKFVDGEQDA